MQLKLFKKGFEMPTAAVIGFVVLAIVAAVGALVISNIKDTLTAGSAASNVTVKTLEGFTNYANLLPVVGIVLIASLILGLVIGAFRTR